MRTALFVYDKVQLTISSTETGLVLVALPGTPVAFQINNPVTLAAGIYKIVSSQALTVTGGGNLVDVRTTPTTYDQFPDPPPRAKTTFPAISTSEIQSFFTIAAAA